MIGCIHFKLSLLGLLGIWSASAIGAIRISEPEAYRGMCDASAAVAIDSKTFAVVSDEDDRIRIYRNEQGGVPLRTVDLSKFLKADVRFPEADLEGAARVGQTAYWISSHALNRYGKVRPGRYRFFGTQIQAATNELPLVPIGRPYMDLLTDFATDPHLKALDLRSASWKLPKAAGGLNIEGLTGTASGELLIAFRNPIPNGKALLVPLVNPADVLKGKKAQFADPIQLDLDGMGVRDIAFFEGSYLIIAGHFDGSGHSRLYRWAGGANAPEKIEVHHFKDYNPEAIIIYPGEGLHRVQILSDDGKRKEKGRQCKDLPPDERTFRSFWLTLE